MQNVLKQKIAHFANTPEKQILITILTILFFIFIFESLYITYTLLHETPENSLYTIQVLKTQMVFQIQKFFGIDVSCSDPITLIYKGHPDLTMRITTACVGIHEIIFLSALILGYRQSTTIINPSGIKLNFAFKWIGIFSILLFIENLVRILTLYPIGILIGSKNLWVYHWYYWKYGHLIIILLLYIYWVMKISRKNQKN